MDGNLVVIDGKVKTPKQYILFNKDWSPKATNSTHKNIWNYSNSNNNSNEKQDNKIKSKLKAPSTHK